MKKTTYFEVWCACRTLGTFETLDEAVKNADGLIQEAVSEGEIDLEEAEEDDEMPCIYQWKQVEHEFSTSRDVEKMYSIDGGLMSDFTESYACDVTMGEYL